MVKIAKTCQQFVIVQNLLNFALTSYKCPYSFPTKSNPLSFPKYIKYNNKYQRIEVDVFIIKAVVDVTAERNIFSETEWNIKKMPSTFSKVEKERKKNE